MALQPPSFFQARLPKTLTSQQQSKDGGKPPSSQTPSASRDVSCASQLLPTGPVLTSHGLQVPASQQVQAAVLTNDLLAVEAHLQSRMRLLEEEKRNLIGKIVELEKNLAQQKEEREAQLQTLTAQNDLVLLQVRCTHQCVVYNGFLTSDSVRSEAAVNRVPQVEGGKCG